MNQAVSSANKLSIVRRVRRRFLTPVSRALVRRRDAQAVAETFAGHPAGTSGLPFFIIVTPGSEKLAARNARTLTEHCSPHLLLNGFSERRLADCRELLTDLRWTKLSALPGYPVKHGTALSLLLTTASTDFGVLDADCLVRDPALLARPAFRPKEFLAAPDHPQFWNLNPKTRVRFPRTHFLVFHHKVVSSLMKQHDIDAEKVVRPPRRLRPALDSLGYGSDNYPRHYLGHFDTLLLLMAMAYFERLEVHWLPASAEQIVHAKPGSANANQVSAEPAA